LQKQKLLKEKLIAKVQANQQATYDLQATKDELNALRVRDQVCKDMSNYVTQFNWEIIIINDYQN